MNYQYWVIRFVPNIARGEFTNIGLVAGRDGGDWAASFETRYVRNHGAFSSDVREVRPWVSWFRRSIQAHAGSPLLHEVSAGWIEQQRARQANSIQFSDPSQIHASSAQEAIKMLFPHLVERTTTRARGLNRTTMRAEVREFLQYQCGQRPGVDFIRAPHFDVGAQHGQFDFFRVAGPDHSLTGVWAFNVQTLAVLERDIQSWNYLLSRLRQDGAELHIGSRAPRPISAEHPIDVIMDPPNGGESDAHRADIFAAALEAWERENVTVRSVEEFERAERELSTANYV